MRILLLKTTSLSLLLACTVISFAQTANFTASNTSGCSPVVINFQNQSTGNPTSYFWDFGNGATSTLVNPSTTYFKPGKYTVKLTATNARGSNTITKTQFIVVWGKPDINFTVNDSTACFPHRAQFTDLSTSSAETKNVEWLWDFGDGSQSIEQNPLHVFLATGNYTITLKITNDKGCYTAFTKPGYIQIAGGVQSSFTNTQPTVCRPPFNINFTNNSTGPNSLTWFWNFGDGQTSTSKNPAHTYTAPGDYTVTLSTTSSGGCSDTLVRDSALKIANIVTSFSAPDSVCIETDAHFINTSSPTPVSTLWNFGDGATSNALDGIEQYKTPNSYTVKMYNTYAYCTDSALKTIKSLPLPTANFTSDKRLKCAPSLTVNFQDLSTNAVGWLWDFGDGSSSTQQHPSHTYTNYGDYNVTLVVTNTSGCTDTLKLDAYIKIKRPQILINPLPIEGCIPFPITFSPIITTLDAVTSYQWDFGDGSPTSSVPTPSHVYTDQGTYPVKLTITTSTGCTETAGVSQGVKVGRHTIVDFDANPKDNCAVTDVNFTNLTDTIADKWLWVFGDGNIAAVKDPVHQYSDTGWMTIKLYATNHGCLDSAIKQQFIHIRPPVARFRFLPNCDNQGRLEFNFKDSSLVDPGMAPITWSWDFGDGSVSNLQNPTHTFPQYGTYNVSLTVTNGSCNNSITQSVKVFNTALDFQLHVVSQCHVGNIQAFSTVQNPSEIVSYSWATSNGQTGSDPNAGFLIYLAGDYKLTLITKDIYGCMDTASKPFRINGPTAEFTSSNPTGCTGITPLFTDISKDDGVNKILNWTWDFGDSTARVSGSGQVEHTYNNLGNYPVKLIVTDAAGCKDSISKDNFVITSDPKANFYTIDSLSCPGGQVSFYSTSDALNYTTKWDFGDSTSGTQNAVIHHYANPGLYTVKLTIMDQYGCTDSLTKDDLIKVKSPVAGYTVKDSVSACTPFEVDFINTSVYTQALQWDLGGGVSGYSNPVQFYNKPGIYNIVLIAISPGLCKDTAYGTITVYDTTGSRINYLPLNGCKPLGVNLNAISPGPMQYTWDFGDGVLVQNDTVGVSHIYNSFGNFTPKVIMADPSGCITPVSGVDTIHIKGATVKFGADAKLLCDSGFIQFTDSTLYNDSLSTYNWNFGDGSISHVQHPVHHYTQPGNYSVLLNVETVSACVDTFRLKDTIRVVESPLISIGGDSVICVNDFMQHLGVFDRTDTSVVKWSWAFPNGNKSNVQLPDKQQYGKAGNFVVSTIAVNSSGCKDTVTKTILVNPLPVVNMPSTITMQSGFPVTIPATYSSNVVNYAWQPVNTLDCGDCASPVASPKFNTTYTVSFVDSNGCRNSGQVQVVVICKNANVFVPNAFSPNNDGVNDVFYVRGKGLDRVKSLRVFNRWGEVVYEAMNFPVNNPVYGWDGKYKGNKPVADVYVYQIEVFCENSEIIRFEGNVALIQ